MICHIKDTKNTSDITIIRESHNFNSFIKGTVLTSQFTFLIELILEKYFLLLNIKAHSVHFFNRLFSDGINWGRVAALLCFAYRLAIKKLKQKAQQFASFLDLIIRHCIRFIKEKVANWIASQGGWVR